MIRKLKPAILYVMLFLGVGAATDSVAQIQQQRWVGDVPIMPDMTIEPGLGFAFDSADGRIVTIYLSGTTDQSALLAYYTQALEPLGWRKANPRQWVRESEILEIKQTQAAGIALWKITLRPE